MRALYRRIKKLLKNSAKKAENKKETRQPKTIHTSKRIVSKLHPTGHSKYIKNGKSRDSGQLINIQNDYICNVSQRFADNKKRQRLAHNLKENPQTR